MSPAIIILRRRWLLAATVVVAFAAAFFLSGERTKEYQANAIVQIITSQQQSGVFISPDALIQLTNVYLEVASSDASLELGRRGSQSRLSVSKLRDHVTVSNDQPGVLRFVGTAPRPDEAVTLVDAAANGFAQYVAQAEETRKLARVAEAQRRLDQLERERSTAPADPASVSRSAIEALQSQISEVLTSPVDSARVIQPARVPSEASSPKPLRDGILAAALVLLIGPALVYVSFLYRGRYGSAEEAAADLDLPLLATVPIESSGSVAATEALRMARLAIHVALQGAGDPRSSGAPIILVTSPGSKAGKTYLTAGFSRVSTVNGQTVAAVDGDLRHPSLHVKFGVPLGIGVREVLHHQASLEDALVAIDRDASQGSGALSLLTAGSGAGDPSDVLASQDFQRLIGTLRNDHGVVFVDSPPVVPVSDPLILSRYASAVVLVVNARRTRRREAQRSLESLLAVGAPVLGIVFNAAPKPGGSGYYSDYYSTVSST